MTWIPRRWKHTSWNLSHLSVYFMKHTSSSSPTLNQRAVSGSMCKCQLGGQDRNNPPYCLKNRKRRYFQKKQKFVTQNHPKSVPWDRARAQRNRCCIVAYKLYPEMVSWDSVRARAARKCSKRKKMDVAQNLRPLFMQFLNTSSGLHVLFWSLESAPYAQQNTNYNGFRHIKPL